MGLFDRFRRRPGRLEPEARWIVTVSADRVEVRDPEGAARGVGLDELGGVAVETNDSGPWGADFWWLLSGPDGRLACAFPQGATGEAEAMQRLSALPGFDHEAMIRASRSVDNATFILWKRA